MEELRIKFQFPLNVAALRENTMVRCLLYTANLLTLVSFPLTSVRWR